MARKAEQINRNKLCTESPNRVGAQVRGGFAQVRGGFTQVKGGFTQVTGLRMSSVGHVGK